MAKKIARVVIANDELAGIIDRGGIVDTELKNLTVEDKGLKKHISDEAEEVLQEGELSVRLDGAITTALVSVSEKYSVDVAAERFAEADKAIRSGAFGDAVKANKALVVPPDKVEAAFAVLKQIGMDVLLETSLDVDPEEYRVLIGSNPSTTERQNAIDLLKSCVKKTTTSRIAYSKK